MTFLLSEHSLHLSHEQLCDHLLELTAVADSAPARSSATGTTGFHVVEDHLRACPLCAAELSSLETALGNFRDATTSFANQELALLRASQPERRTLLSMTLPTLPTLGTLPGSHGYRKPFLWALAAVLLVGATLGSVVPLGLHRHQAIAPSVASVAAVATLHPSSPASVSDQALLEEVDDDLSSNVPSAMQPLSDPLSAPAADSAETAPSTQISSQVPVRKITHE